MKTFEGYYLKKDYPNALLTLEKHQQEIESGLWHYDMGTVFGEMQNWPMARYHFIMADARGFNSKELAQNQRLTEAALEVGKLEKPLDTSDYLIKSALVAAEGPLVTLSLIFVVLGLWTLKKSPSIKRALVFVFVVLTPLVLDLWIDSWPRKIVTAPKSLFEGPSALFEARGEIPAGIFVITNTKEDWEEIIYPARYSGWVKADGMKKLELK